ncbi:MAG: TIGR04211 family SH3 domain-containing protein [Pseudomonadota bacterium]
MQNSNYIKYFSFLLLLFISPLLSAKTVYVSDELTILMRTEKGVGFRILKSLPSGTKLRVLQVDKSGYTQVKNEAGTSGWVLSRFLSKKPIARDLLKQAQDTSIQLKQEKNLLKQELAEIKKEKSLLGQSEKNLLKKNNTISTELVKLRKIAARPMQLEKSNEKLRNELLSNESQTRLLKQELQTLKDDSEKQWFITGAVILFSGILLGLILPNLRSNPQRKQNWNRL